MASAKARDPQTWNRYAYTLNNPLRFVDPDGLEVPDSCVKDPKCVIVVRVTAIYDNAANRGKGLTKEQKKRFEQEQYEKAKKDYGRSNIRLEVQYTAADTYTYGTPTVFFNPPLDKNSLNVLVGTWTPTGAPGASGVDRETDTALTFIDMNQAHDAPSPGYTNTTTHEFGHQFLGHGYLPDAGFFERWYREREVDSRVRDQSSGHSQQDFREGLKNRRYAAPLNPEANKPKQ